MIDIVYTLGNGSTWNDNEIRYSLRSVQKHLSGFGRVYIVGKLPDFLTNVIHIPVDDERKGIADTNIMRKLKIACENPNISETFLFMNDDHYLLKPFEADKFPYYYSGTISQYIRTRGADSYGRRSMATKNSLEDRSLPTKYFDIHYPILYNKKAFLKDVVGQYQQAYPDGMILKSLYANAQRIEGVEIEDCKKPFPLVHKLPCFSTFPRVNAGTYRFLNDQFPDKSRFEL